MHLIPFCLTTRNIRFLTFCSTFSSPHTASYRSLRLLTEPKLLLIKPGACFPFKHKRDVQPNFEKMKTIKVTLFVVLGLVVAACNDDDGVKSTNKLTSEE